MDVLSVRRTQILTPAALQEKGKGKYCNKKEKQKFR